VERVTGRLTKARAAGAGAVSGLWLGLLFGLLIGLFAAGHRFHPVRPGWATLCSAVGGQVGDRA
jgi:hypothetical protein